ncbi:hypothetical protein ASPWEDRAFT_171430 [Aspergillus wentii DTO 134E9]|uniref:Uncharacterized protein n=1 Tax=Aspergillus wentii DTO 134E9 TaxID=1073089 RepID=A0A1L9RT03_ASPWE|nr:uncharacterized protein ASPWEDRAFT_171430 [Aspergillus wentii DTO 134E9]OJJ37978.1 hypothetical protein ASPWEDRAFT_171430 [Aspergillus wentii DTO 134E9]
MIEEELPLFNIPSTFPSSTATPNEVRTYLGLVLASKHDTNPDYANEIANKWVLGRGSHLHKATRDDFITTFGREVGGYLYSSVQEDISSSWYHHLYCFFSHWAPPVCTVLALIFLAMACLYPDQYKEYLRYASYCLGPPLFACAFTREGDQRAAMCLGGGVCTCLMVVLLLV